MIQTVIDFSTIPIMLLLFYVPASYVIRLMERIRKQEGFSQ